MQHCIDDATASMLYDLYAVLVHAGSANSGHYYAVVRDLTSDVRPWWVFNDERVRALAPDSLSSYFGNHDRMGSTAYMLMYWRRDPTGPAGPAGPAPARRRQGRHKGRRGRPRGWPRGRQGRRGRRGRQGLRAVQQAHHHRAPPTSGWRGSSPCC